MQRDARRFGEGLETVGNHLCAQVSDFLAGEGELHNRVWTVGEVYDAETQRLVERNVCRSVTGQANWRS